MIGFIDEHREAYGVEPICRVLPIAPSTCHAHAARRADPGRMPGRARRDAALCGHIRRVREDNFAVYGVRKIWRQLGREGIGVGPVHGGPTDAPDGPARRRSGKDEAYHGVPRPNRLRVSDFTCVASRAGFVYVAFVIDAFARRIVAWRASRSAETGFVLDALEQALHDRRPVGGKDLVHHSDRGVQYVSIKYTERLTEAGHRALGRQCRRHRSLSSGRHSRTRGTMRSPRP